MHNLQTSCVQDLGLNRGEQLQIANLRPSAPVEVYLVSTAGHLPACTASRSDTGWSRNADVYIVPQHLPHALRPAAVACAAVRSSCRLKNDLDLLQIVKDCEGRLTGDQVDELLALVKKHRQP